MSECESLDYAWPLREGSGDKDRRGLLYYSVKLAMTLAIRRNDLQKLPDALRPAPGRASIASASVRTARLTRLSPPGYARRINVLTPRLSTSWLNVKR